MDPVTIKKENKLKFIVNAIESGFTVKKSDSIKNAYEFEIDGKKLIEPVKKTDKKEDPKRSTSMPASKSDTVKKLFKIPC